ncbi:hypothetical protein CGZ93_17770 [Enemella dayhoffiae]|uniref:Uncharacterized protein n=1 Tax=Enemella dayhoffiae TaxID=2016507 RepID=A0A255GLB8_9ACTN|nr:hypothetical protein [Enemella dayhoffiae]OYO16609.1 hypothetical protein CGZ93_17770 [Enemella dayhoffiae]
MAERRYINPRTGEVNDDPAIRPFDQVLRDLSEGATNRELSDRFWDLLQAVQETAKAGSLTFTLSIGFDGVGRIEIKDEIKTKIPEHNRQTTAFFIDQSGNATRRDPNQPEIPGVRHLPTQEAN